MFTYAVPCQIKGICLECKNLALMEKKGALIRSLDGITMREQQHSPVKIFFFTVNNQDSTACITKENHVSETKLFEEISKTSRCFPTWWVIMECIKS